MDDDAPSTRALPASATLADHARFFVGSTTPRIMAIGLGTVVALRAVLAPWTLADTILAVALLLFTPFFEWGIHVFVLHFRPITLFGRTFDLWIARSHREHHLDPPSLAKKPADTGKHFAAFYGIATLAGWAVFRSLPLALDFVVWASSYVLLYEWMHYLIHSNHQPRTRYFRAVRNTHLAHHYRNERYWFGVVSKAADVVLGTHPDLRDVDRSPSARALGAAPTDLR